MTVTLPQDKILEGLNTRQAEAVTHAEGPQLIVAGAGTGKTTVITRRIAHLVAAKRCQAREILALTFTDKAAEEMESRVDVLVPYGFTDSTVCTFHAFGDRILREQGVVMGMNPDYRVLTQTEQLVFLRERLFELPLVRLRPLSDPTRHLQLLVSIISRAKDEDVRPAEYMAYCEHLGVSLGSSADEAARTAWEKQREIAAVYAKYQELMTASGLVDFGDLIIRTLDLFRQNPDLLAEYQQRYRFLLVDEFQDTNAAQFALIKLLAGDDANLTVVGDDDQSIYKFRGAAISNILQFTQTYPAAKIRVLNENYRSTQLILDTANRLIHHNDPDRLEIRHKIDKRLISSRGEGAPVTHRHFETVSAEADWVAAEIVRRQQQGDSWSDFAVLVRTNRQADPFIRALNVHAVPLRFSGSQGLYRRPEIRLCLAFLRTVADPASSLPLHDLAASELYHLPAEDLALLAASCRRRHSPLLAALRAAVLGDGLALSDAGRESGQRLLDDLGSYSEAARRLPTGQLLYQFLTDSRLLARYTEANSLEGDFAIKNLAKFFNVIKRYERIAKSDRVLYFIQHLDMLEEAGEDPALAEANDETPAVNVLTVHRSKGLEFPTVFIVGMAANRFPPIHRQSSLDLPVALAKEEVPVQDPFVAEERRLFYVAMTRAKSALLLTSAVDYGGSRSYKLSRFVMEALEISKADIKPSAAAAIHEIHAQSPVPEPAPQNPGALAANAPLSLSYYQISDYASCPLKYKYVHILNIPVLPHHSILYGNAVHTAVQALYRQRLATGRLLLEDELLGIFKTAWVNEGFISREHEEMRMQAGLSALKNLLRKELLTPSNPKYIERSFNFTLGHNKIIGRMDRVDILPDGRAVIIDFKSSEVADQKEADKKAQESLQMKIYASAWFHTEGALPARMELSFLESGLIGTAVFEPETVEKTDDQILEVAGEIRKQDFTPKPSSWTCSYCPYRTICPEAVV